MTLFPIVSLYPLVAFTSMMVHIQEPKLTTIESASPFLADQMDSIARG
jgi:hypothetical protein